MISSKQNGEIKLLRSLKQRKYRQREKLFVIEGIRIIEEAINDGADILKVYYSPLIGANPRAQRLLKELEKKKIVKFLIEEKLFYELAETEAPQGILAVVKEPDYDLNDLLKFKSLYPHIILINGVQDPGNLGNILRTAAAAGWAGAILSKGTVDLYNPKAIRSTMGAIHKIPILRKIELTDLLYELRQRNFQIIATGLAGELQHFEIDFSQPTVIIVGNEGNGVDPELLYSVDDVVKIPMDPQAESLNVAVAAGIVIFEGVRQNLLK